MSIRTAEQLRKNLESIKKDNEQRIARLEARLTEIEEHGGNTAAIKRELEQAKMAAKKSEDLAAKSLTAAEDRELKAAQETEEIRKRVSDELEARQKFRSERAWIAAGGDPKAFEAHWPTLKEELLKQEVFNKTAAQEANQTFVGGL